MNKLKEKAIQLEADLAALYLCLKDPAAPPGAKIVAWITIAYALSPIDLIPDFIPVLGYLDDCLILPLLVTFCIHLLPSDMLAAYRQKVTDELNDKGQKHWYYALPVIFFWLVVLFIIIKIIT